jgi:hypothetical protein
MPFDSVYFSNGIVTDVAEAASRGFAESAAAATRGTTTTAAHTTRSVQERMRRR